MKLLGREGPPGNSCTAKPQGSGGSHAVPSPLPRRERELIRHREELLEATGRLLGAKSHRELTVNDIAAESEFSVGYIYKLFANKEEILATLIRAKLQDLRHIVEEGLFGIGPWESKAERLVREMFSWLDREPAYRSGVTSHLREFAATHSSVAADFAAFLEFYASGIDRLFSEAVHLGDLKEECPNAIARVFRAMVAGFSEERLQLPGSPATASQDARLIVHVVKRAFAVEGGAD